MTENNDKKLNLLLHAKKVSETKISENGKEMNFVSLNVKQPIDDGKGSKKIVSQQISFITSPKLISEVWFNSSKKEIANKNGELYTPLYTIKFEDGKPVKPVLDENRKGYVSVFIPQPPEGEKFKCAISYRTDVEAIRDEDGNITNYNELYTKSKPAELPFEVLETIVKTVSSKTQNDMKNIIEKNKNKDGVFDTLEYLIDDEVEVDESIDIKKSTKNITK